METILRNWWDCDFGPEVAGKHHITSRVLDLNFSRFTLTRISPFTGEMILDETVNQVTSGDVSQALL